MVDFAILILRTQSPWRLGYLRFFLYRLGPIARGNSANALGHIAPEKPISKLSFEGIGDTISKAKKMRSSLSRNIKIMQPNN
jgi:hypothetical protein